MAKVLMKGNEAIAEAAIRAGCLNYFAYPITPQSDVAEYLSWRLPEVGGVFLQGESEVAVSYMIFGAAACGERVFTTSSSPGISLMSEGISYISAAECPAVFVNIMRGGPGLGGILPSQADYNQSVKGGGHGDYRMLVLAPASVQEAAEMTMMAFPLAEKYRNPCRPPTISLNFENCTIRRRNNCILLRHGAHRIAEEKEHHQPEHKEQSGRHKPTSPFADNSQQRETEKECRR